MVSRTARGDKGTKRRRRRKNPSAARSQELKRADKVGVNGQNLDSRAQAGPSTFVLARRKNLAGVIIRVMCIYTVYIFRHWLHGCLFARLILDYNESPPSINRKVFFSWTGISKSIAVSEFLLWSWRFEVQLPCRWLRDIYAVQRPIE